MNGIETLRVGLRQAFFPDRCCVCGRLLHAGNDICKECIPVILHVPKTGFCRGCGRPMKNCMCIPEPFLTAVAAPFLFTGDVREQIHKFKFRNIRHLAVPYAKITAKYIEDCGVTDGAQLLTFIPMTPKAVQIRTYNQAQVFADELSKILQIPCEQTLTKRYETPTQHDLPAVLRHGNLTGVYELPPEKEEVIRDKVILLVDDITTTGSTLHEAAKTLLIFGAKEVRGVCIARAPAKDQKLL